MTSTTRNEAAERLHGKVARYVPDGVPLLDAALAAERRATVERIWEAMTHPERVGEMPNTAILLRDILAILDEEAAR